VGHGCTLQAFEHFLRHPSPKAVILRHDIDKLPANALKMAHLEHDLGVAGSYYFRVVPGVWDPGEQHGPSGGPGRSVGLGSGLAYWLIEPGVKELVWQNVKNGVKRVGVRLGLLAY
jgi:hypothetical protein